MNKLIHQPKTAAFVHTVTIIPGDPGIVIFKVIVDNGGYEQTHLKMTESLYIK
jgi:hypothetical protein